MILTWAKDSRYYAVDEDGRVYTARHLLIDPKGIHGPRPGERPHPLCENAIGGHYRQIAGAVAFWEPTGQQREQLTLEQTFAIRDAQERRRALVEVWDEKAARLYDLEEELAKLA